MTGLRKRLVLVIPDGMADRPLPDLDGKTPTEAAATPIMDSLASRSLVGTVRNVPAGMPPGSDVAIMSVMGYDPAKSHRASPARSSRDGHPARPLGRCVAVQPRLTGSR